MSQTSLQEREMLETARTLIRGKNYAEARKILRKLPNHPIAQKWLANLDQIVPEANVKRETQTAKRQTQTLDAKRQTQSMPVQPRKKSIIDLMDTSMGNALTSSPPEHPFRLTVAQMDWSILLFAPFPIRMLVRLFRYFAYGLALSNNWYALGRPAWATPTLIIAVILPLAPIILGFVFASTADSPTSFQTINMVWFALSSFFCVGNIAFPLTVGYLQLGAYRKWDRTRDKRLMLDHQYAFGQVCLFWFMIVAAFGLVCGGSYALVQYPMARDHGTYTVNLPMWWLPLPPSENAICQNRTFQCQGYYTDNIVLEEVNILFYQQPHPYPYLEMDPLDERLWRNYATYFPLPNATPIRRYRANVDNHPTLVYEFTRSYTTEMTGEKGRAYDMVIYISHGEQLIMVHVQFASEEVYNSRRDEVYKHLRSIKFS